jgi:hypothetical protein
MCSLKKWDGMVIVTKEKLKKEDSHLLSMLNREVSILQKKVDVLEKKILNKIELLYDAQLGAYRIPPIVDRSKFQVLNAYCEIIKND